MWPFAGPSGQNASASFVPGQFCPRPVMSQSSFVPVQFCPCPALSQASFKKEKVVVFDRYMTQFGFN